MRKVYRSCACIVVVQMTIPILHRTNSEQNVMASLLTPLGRFLSASRWSASLSVDELRRVESEIMVKKISAGGYVCRKGEPVDAWIGVISGLAKMSLFSASGKLTTLTGVPSGGWFGEGSIMKDEARKYDIMALRACQVAYMPRATFMRLLNTNIGFNRFLIVQLNERLGQFITIVEGERLLEPDARVARALGALFNPVLYPGLGRELQISQEEIGLLSGVSRQRVNQALQVLERAGLLKVESVGITVVDLPGLQRFEAS